MASGDGDGWVQCRCGQRHWGLHGAAGLLLLRAGAADGGCQVLLQLRAGWTHQGGSWGVPGGAADSHEDSAGTALREAHEEAAVDPSQVRVVDVRVGVDHGDWRYAYVLAYAVGPLHPWPVTAESDAITWVSLSQVHLLPLHQALAQAWPELHTWLSHSRPPNPPWAGSTVRRPA